MIIPRYKIGDIVYCCWGSSWVGRINWNIESTTVLKITNMISRNNEECIEYICYTSSNCKLFIYQGIDNNGNDYFSFNSLFLNPSCDRYEFMSNDIEDVNKKISGFNTKNERFYLEDLNSIDEDIENYFYKDAIKGDFRND